MGAGERGVGSGEWGEGCREWGAGLAPTRTSTVTLSQQSWFFNCALSEKFGREREPLSRMARREDREVGILRPEEGSGKGPSQQGRVGGGGTVGRDRDAWESRVGAELWLEGGGLRSNHTFPRPADLTDPFLGNESDKPTALKTEQMGQKGARRWARRARGPAGGGAVS